MQLREHAAAFEQHDTAVLAISSEDQKQAAAIKRELDLPFAVLADPGRRAITAYGVFHEQEPKGRLLARPAVFVIDPNGKISYQAVGDAPTDRPATEMILAAVAAATALSRAP